MSDRVYVDFDVWESDGTFEVGSVLPTKDGRMYGNGIIESIDKNSIYRVITDFGNIIKCSSSKIEDNFHKPKYVTTLTKWNSDHLTNHARLCNGS